MWTLYIDDDDNNRTVLKLTREQYAIGRAADNTIRLTERNVSRHHAALHKDSQGRWTLTDLDSDNGCFVNGRRITEPMRLTHSDFLQVGDYRLRLLDNEAARGQPELEDDTLRAVPRGPGNEPVDRLVVVAGPSVGVSYPLHVGTLLIGRGEECEIALPDTSVSRVHAEIVGSDTGYELIDRGSSNGLHVNGVELARTFLQPSDVIELGDVFLKFVPKGEIFVGALPSEPPPAPDMSALNQAFVADPAAAARGRNRTTAIAIAAVGLGAVVLFLLLRSGPDAQPAHVVALEQKPVTGAVLTVQAARKLLADGDVSGAHEKLRELPSDSNLRQTEEVMEIERTWADTIFDMVDEDPDPAHKKAMLTEIASTEGINNAQRKRAATQLEKLESPSVELSELPEEEPPPAPTPVVARHTTRRPSVPKPQTAPATPAEEPSAAPAPAPAPTPPKKKSSPAEEDGLIRDLPF
jgi:pSer/pThr/pTyr-binding forkhead associated (FHA) protein